MKRLLWFSIYFLFIITGESTPVTLNCGTSECKFEASVSCTDLIANNKFTGTCCSLADSLNGNCIVTTTSGLCHWKPQWTLEDAVFLASISGVDCPTSEYVVFAPPKKETEAPITTINNEENKDADENSNEVSRVFRRLQPFDVVLRENQELPSDINVALRAVLESVLTEELYLGSLDKIELVEMATGSSTIFSFFGKAVYFDSDNVPSDERLQDRQRELLLDFELVDYLKEEDFFITIDSISFEEENIHQDDGCINDLSQANSSSTTEDDSDSNFHENNAEDSITNDLEGNDVGSSLPEGDSGSNSKENVFGSLPKVDENDNNLDGSDAEHVVIFDGSKEDVDSKSASVDVDETDGIGDKNSSNEYEEFENKSTETSLDEKESKFWAEKGLLFWLVVGGFVTLPFLAWYTGHSKIKKKRAKSKGYATMDDDSNLSPIGDEEDPFPNSEC